MNYLNATTQFTIAGINFKVKVARGQIYVCSDWTSMAGWAGFVSTNLEFFWDDSLFPVDIRAAAEQAIRDKAKANQDKAARRNAKARERRAVKDDVMDSVGMKRVRGNLGGTFYE